MHKVKHFLFTYSLEYWRLYKRVILYLYKCSKFVNGVWHGTIYLTLKVLHTKTCGLWQIDLLTCLWVWWYWCIHTRSTAQEYDCTYMSYTFMSARKLAGSTWSWRGESLLQCLSKEACTAVTAYAELSDVKQSSPDSLIWFIVWKHQDGLKIQQTVWIILLCSLSILKFLANLYHTVQICT